MKKKQKIVGSIIILIFFLLIIFVGYFVSKSKKISDKDIFVESDSNSNISTEVKTDKSLVVEIKGAVKKPGVYSLNAGSRVLDLVNKSEGFTNEADKDSVILVTKLKDSDCIVVKKLGEISKSVGSRDSNSMENSKLNLNTATIEEIVSAKFPRIGAGTAKKIVDYREKNGFKTIEDLRKVGGIGETTINAIKDRIEIR